MHDRRHKVRFAVGGNIIEHAHVDVRATSVQITTAKLLLLASIHQQHEVIIVDFENACLNAETSEKVWTNVGEVFGALPGKIVRILKALHGLVSSGRCFQMHLRSTLRSMIFEPSSHDDNL